MFGKNVITKADYQPVDLQVEEIFYTLQGEGPFAGRPAVFVRLAGCPLRCQWCDTQFDIGLSKPRMRVDDIMREVQRHAAAIATLVVITGGEPLRQNITPLMYDLAEVGFTIQIETAGVVVPPGFLEVVEDIGAVVVCSPKTSKVHPYIAESVTHWKYVVGADDLSESDGLPFKNPQAMHVDSKVFRPYKEAVQIWVSPRDDHDAEKNAANVQAAVQTCLRYGYRLSLQVHKLVNLP